VGNKLPLDKGLAAQADWGLLVSNPTIFGQKEIPEIQR
jgi:hypothetical protein